MGRGTPFDARALLAWGLSIAWAAFIWGLGSDGFSNESTSGILDPLLQWLFPGLDLSSREALHWGIRKSAHAAEYGVLALLLVRALWLSGVVGAAALGLATVALVSLLAASDEWRQGSSIHREGTAADAVLDIAGGIAAVAFVYFLPTAIRSWWLPNREAQR